MTPRDEVLLDELRPVAFAIAYRMLGSVAQAEDVVQESLLRVHRLLAAGEPIASPRAYVTTVATRLAIDELRSARARRETYVAEWLPEPLVAVAAGDDPAREAEPADTLSLAFLVLLESLSPERRAVFLLRDERREQPRVGRRAPSRLRPASAPRSTPSPRTRARSGSR